MRYELQQHKKSSNIRYWGPSWLATFRCGLRIVATYTVVENGSHEKTLEPGKWIYRWSRLKPQKENGFSSISETIQFLRYTVHNSNPDCSHRIPPIATYKKMCALVFRFSFRFPDLQHSTEDPQLFEDFAVDVAAHRAAFRSWFVRFCGVKCEGEDPSTPHFGEEGTTLGMGRGFSNFQGLIKNW